MRLPAGRRVGLVGRNGSGKTTLLRLIRGELGAGCRRGAAQARRAGRRGRAGGAGGRREPARGRARGRSRARAPAAGGRARPGRGRDRRGPDPARRHRRPCRAGAGERDPERPRLRRGRPGPAARELLGRLADACGAGRGAVRRARSVAARRADQPPRPRGQPLARGLSLPLPALAAPGQPRPPSAQPRAAADRPPRPAPAHRLCRRLRRVRARAARADRARGEGARQAGREAAPHAGLRRPLPLQGEQGAPGAEPAQGDRAPRADCGGRSRRPTWCCAFRRHGCRRRP